MNFTGLAILTLIPSGSLHILMYVNIYWLFLLPLFNPS
ncbi:hypothetical protein LT85_3010 [Collimonas arenae]|uniref:Uncharacterized protein n=1 Tax=Collimonas arenae TaxID=279058 RepID=A0A0A1FBP7_9BURK|nr:hypothetical protein LT85_3010 [Collimonas arenae]